MLLDIAEQYIDWTNALSKKVQQMYTRGSMNDLQKCRACRKTGSPDWPIAVCVSCGTTYHLDCCQPAIEEEEKDTWKCKICVQEERRQQRESEEKEKNVDDDYEGSDVSDEEESMYSSNDDDDSDFFTGPVSNFINFIAETLCLKNVRRRQLFLVLVHREFLSESSKV